MYEMKSYVARPIIMTSLKKIHFLLVAETMRFRLNDIKTNFDHTLIINLS